MHGDGIYREGPVLGHRLATGTAYPQGSPGPGAREPLGPLASHGLLCLCPGSRTGGEFQQDLPCGGHVLLGDSAAERPSPGPACVPSETRGLHLRNTGLAAGTDQSQPCQAGSVPATHLQTPRGPRRPPPGPSPSLDLSSQETPRRPLLWPGANGDHHAYDRRPGGGVPQTSRTRKNRPCGTTHGSPRAEGSSARQTGRGAGHGALLFTGTADFRSPDTGSLIPPVEALPWLGFRDPAVSDGDHWPLGQRHEGKALSGNGEEAGLRQAAPDNGPQIPFPKLGDTVTKLKHSFIYSFINTVVFTSILYL